MSTRNSINKYLTTECYKASKEFPPGRLPTLKQVLERCLFFKEYRTESVQREVSEELHNLWTKYNVYPISTNAIQMRLNNHIKEFSRLLNYDEKKQGPKFKMDALKFIEESNKLFDIYQKDHKILAAAEKKYLLKMTDDDHKFYEEHAIRCMMDFGGLDVGVNCKYETLFEEKEDEPLFTLIDQGLPGGAPPRNNFVENVFNSSLDEDLFSMSMYERNLLMTMQMTSGSSVGLGQTGRSASLASVDSLGGDRDYHKMYTDWSSNLTSRSFSDEDYGKGRERNFSTSSFTGPCIPPDLMNYQLNSSTDEFLVDSLPDIEDVQEQIFLEDGHQNLQPDDLLIPLDEPIDGKALQEQLISQITGNDQSLLANDTLHGSTKEALFDTLPCKSEVKKVEAAPGSQNVCIDGMDVQLPAGSVILAVVNESGTLVPIPATTPSFGDDGTKIVPVSGFDSSVSASSLSNSIIPADDNLCLPSERLLEKTHETLGIPGVSGSDCVNSQLIAGGNAGDLSLATSIKKEIPDACFDDINAGEKFLVKDEAPSEMNETISQGSTFPVQIKKEIPDHVETKEELIDIETISEKTPVIEAVDLDSLLAEFEATESVNMNMDKNVKKENEFEHQEEVVTASESAFNTSGAGERPSCDDALGSQIQEKIRCKADPSDLRPIASGKEKMEQQPTKPVKNLVERKNQMMLRKLAAHQKIKDSLPFEIIEKIRASAKRSRTKVLSEALLPRLRGKKLANKSKLLKKNHAKKKEKNAPIQVQKRKTCDNISSTPHPTDHDYCISPQKRSKAKEKEESPPNVYNKLPDYFQPPVSNKTTKASAAEVEDSCKKDSGVESGDVSDSSIEIEDKKRGCKTSQSPESSLPDKTECATEKSEASQEGSVYSRLPDYVTDIGNVQPKEEVIERKEEWDSNSDPQSVPPSADDTTKVEVKEEEPKKKKKLKLDEYRMRMISSANNSRSNSPFVGEDLLSKKVLKNQITESAESEQKASEPPSSVNEAPSAATVEEREEGEIKEEAEEGSTSNIPQKDIVSIKGKTVPTPKKNAHRTKLDAYREAKAAAYREAKAAAHREGRIAAHREQKSRVNHSSNAKPSKRPPKQPTVIEIDLEEEEEEKEKQQQQQQQQKGQTKLGLIDSLPLSKMPTTSLGHSLLYSRKNGENVDKKTNKYDSSKSSTRHRASSSRSRSRSWSSKRSSRSHKSKGSSRYTSHRKSRRRWSRSRSRGRSRSRSYSPSTSSSYSSIYSSRSRSRSRSRSQTRSSKWDSRSRRSKRYSRSRERSRDRSRRRSWSRSPREWGSSRKRARSPNWGYHSRSPYGPASRYGQSHPSGRYASRHRSLEEIERDVQERRVIYVGAIEEGTTRADLRRRFDKFGPIVDINIHFRERGDNYGFVTFRYREHAYQALERGNEDPLLPKYNLCFGGRRAFCKVQYSDLDAQGEDYGYHATPSSMDYDTLLKAALHMRR